MKARFVVLLSSLLLLTFCSKNDPCPTCLNGGLCVSGACECPEGFIGFDCGGEQTPTSMFIEELTITRFPSFTQSGSAWDVLDSPEPDILFVIGREGESQPFYLHSQYVQNAKGGEQYTFRNLSIKLDNPGAQRYTINLFDYDSTTQSDFMDGVVFLPYVKGNKFPEVLDLDLAGVTVAFKVKVRYVF